jgi:WD40 repeat protein
MSPDGQTIVTGAGDETLRFWNVFPTPKSESLQLLATAFSEPLFPLGAARRLCFALFSSVCSRT